MTAPKSALPAARAILEKAMSEEELLVAVTEALAEVRRGVEGLAPEMVRKDYLVPDPKWDDLVSRAAVLALLADPPK